MTKFLLFDLDDTLAATHQYIKDNLEPCEPTKKEMELLDKNNYSYIMGSDKLQAHIDKQILKPKAFISEADLATWVDDNFIEFKAHLKDLSKQGVKFGICTHRGWDPAAQPLSEAWLKHKNLTELIGVNGYISSKVDPCKLTWGNSTLPSPFVLVDDNPVSHNLDDFTERTFKSQVVLCEAEQRFDKYKHFDRFNHFHVTMEMVNLKLGV